MVANTSHNKSYGSNVQRTPGLWSLEGSLSGSGRRRSRRARDDTLSPVSHSFVVKFIPTLIINPEIICVEQQQLGDGDREPLVPPPDEEEKLEESESSENLLADLKKELETDIHKISLEELCLRLQTHPEMVGPVLISYFKHSPIQTTKLVKSSSVSIADLYSTLKAMVIVFAAKNGHKVILVE